MQMQVTLATPILVVGRQHRLVSIAAMRRPAVGEMMIGHRPHHVTLVGTRLPTAGVMTVGHHRHHVTLVETRPSTAGVMTTGRHRHHLALIGMAIDAMIIDVVAMAEIAVSPLRVIVDAATRFRGVHVLVDVMSMSVHRRHVERAAESETGTLIMTAEKMVRGRDTGIADADTNDHVTGYLLFMSTLFRLCYMLRDHC